MKKLFTLMLLAAFATVTASAEDGYIPPRKYFNIGYVQQDVQIQFDGEYQDVDGYEWGASLERGRTYFFNKKSPILGMVRIGLDWSYIDLQYASYKTPIGDGESFNSHFANIGMQVGPSVTVTPLKGLNIKVYGHYAPSFAAFGDEKFENILGGYAGHLTAGIHASFKVLTLGVELRNCKAQLSEVKTDEGAIDGDLESVGDLFGEKHNVKLPATRFIVGFRF